MLAKHPHVQSFGVVLVIKLDQRAVLPAQGIRLPHPQRRPYGDQHEPVKFLPLPYGAGVKAWLADAGLGKFANRDPLLVIEKWTWRRHDFPRLTAEGWEFRQLVETFFNVPGVPQDKPDEDEILLEGCRFDQAPGLRFLERESFAKGQQEFRVDIGDLDTIEILLQQIPFDLVLLALALRHLPHLVGVDDERLSDVGEGAAVQVL